MGKTLPRDDNSVPLQNTYKSITSKRKTVALAGTPVQLITASTACKKIDIMALPGNTKTIVIGDSTVVATPASVNGMYLNAGGSYTIFVTDVSNIYMDSEVNGEGCTFNYFD